MILRAALLDLRSNWRVLLVLLLVLAASLFATGLIAERIFPTLPQDWNYAAGYLIPFALDLPVLLLFAVAWHRIVLMGPSAWGVAALRRLPIYLFDWLWLFLLFTAVSTVLLFLTFAPFVMLDLFVLDEAIGQALRDVRFELNQILQRFPQVFILSGLLAYLTLRLGLRLPARAVGHGPMGLRASWRATSHLRVGVLVAAFVFAVISLVVTAASEFSLYLLLRIPDWAPNHHWASTLGALVRVSLLTACLTAAYRLLRPAR